MATRSSYDFFDEVARPVALLPSAFRGVGGVALGAVATFIVLVTNGPTSTTAQG